MDTITDASILLVLKEIQLECYRQITIEQRGGRAIPENELEPYPDKEEYCPDIMLEDYTLDKLVADTQKEDPQIDIEEAIQNAPKQSSDEPKPQEPTSKAEAKEPRNRGGKLKAYFDAIRDWHYVKHEKEYKYQCAKQQTYDRIYGFEHIAKYVDNVIKKWQREFDDNSGTPPIIG